MVTKKHIHTDLPITAGIEEGTDYKSGSPERRSIAEKGTPGKKLVFKGHVLDMGSNPVPHAWLDFWQADGSGKYDDEGFNLRGHQYADHEGAFHLETVRPAAYEGRAPHIHVKVRASKNTPMLITQVFFPDAEENCDDPLYTGATVVDLAETGKGQEANFDFVVDTEQI